MKQNLVNALPKLLAILPKDNDDSNMGIKFLKKIDCFFAAGKKKSTRRKIVEILKVFNGTREKYLSIFFNTKFTKIKISKVFIILCRI